MFLKIKISLMMFLLDKQKQKSQKIMLQFYLIIIVMNDNWKANQRRGYPHPIKILVFAAKMLRHKQKQ
jgi:hypothetical protein